MIFKKMTSSEYDEYLVLALNSYAHELEASGLISKGMGKDIAKRQFSNLFTNGIDTPNTYFYNIINDNDIKIGTLIYGTRQAKEAYIYDILIFNDFQNQGYGKKALQLLEEEAKKLGFERIGLHVFGNNPIARHLYEKQGFEIVSMQMQKKL